MNSLLNFHLIPQSGLEYWHAVDGLADGDPADEVTDYSGNNRPLAAASNPPVLDADVIQSNLLEMRDAVYFDGSNTPLSNVTPLVLKHFFILAKFDGAAFASTEGLLSGTSSINILAGAGAAETKFYNLALGYTYKKDGVTFAESNLQAPMDTWGLLEISRSGGFSMVGIQFGQQLGGAAAKWTGWLAESLAYSRVLSDAERLRVLMHFNLKFGAHNFADSANTLYFPSDDFLDFRRSRFYAEPPDYKAITDDYQFEDAGMTFNERADTAPRRWEYEYLARTPEQAAIFDEFFNQARFINTFNFIDKYGETHTDVRIESYNRAHEAHKSWRNDIKFVLVKYP